MIGKIHVVIDPETLTNVGERIGDNYVALSLEYGPVLLHADDIERYAVNSICDMARALVPCVRCAWLRESLRVSVTENARDLAREAQARHMREAHGQGRCPICGKHGHTQPRAVWEMRLVSTDEVIASLPFAFRCDAIRAFQTRMIDAACSGTEYRIYRNGRTVALYASV